MTIEEIRKAKALLEEKLTKSARQHVAEFVDATGMQVSEINFSWVNMTNFSRSTGWHEVSGVTVKVETGL